MEQRVRELLVAADWERHILELAKYVNWRINFLSWRTGTDGLLPEGKSADDIVYASIQGLFEGTRKWNPERVDLKGELRGIASSLINNLVNKLDNIIIVPEKEVYGNEMWDSYGDQPNENGSSADPEKILIDKEQYELSQQLILAKIPKGSDLESVVLCIMDGCTKPQQISEMTGIEKERIYQLKRQLISILNSIFENNQETINH
ncbi:MAG: hypothetical protein ACMUIP_06985 [bacterium]